MVVSPERIRSLHKYEKAILVALERQMKRYEWVPLESLQQATGLAESEVNYRLSRLIQWGMVRFNPVPYDGYALVFGGYDTLALTTLTRKGVISALGTKIGEGKESVVFDALGLGPVAIKFHRIGQRSFNTARVNCEYIPQTGELPVAACLPALRRTRVRGSYAPPPESFRPASHRPEQERGRDGAYRRAGPFKVPVSDPGPRLTISSQTCGPHTRPA